MVTPLFFTIGAWALLSGLWWVGQRWLFQRQVSKPVVMFASGCGAGLMIIFSLFWLGLPELSPGVIWLFLLEAVLTGIVIYCFTSAVEKSEASLAASVTVFAPVLIVITGYFLLGELPSVLKIVGIVIILVGTYVMNLVPGARSWVDPLRVVWRRRGSWLWYAVAAAVAASVAIPLEKRLVLATNNFFAPGVYLLLGTGVYWGFVGWWRGSFREMWQKPGRSRILPWLVLVGMCFGLANASQAAAFYFELAAPVAALKRLDGVVAVLLGWLWLRETNIRSRLPGMVLIAIGALLIGIG